MSEIPCDFCDDAGDFSSVIMCEACYLKGYKANRERVANIVAVIRETAKRIPLGGTIRIKGSEPISGYNLAEHVARIVECVALERDVYDRLCGQPEKKAEASQGGGGGT